MTKGSYTINPQGGGGWGPQKKKEKKIAALTRQYQNSQMRKNSTEFHNIT